MSRTFKRPLLLLTSTVILIILAGCSGIHETSTPHPTRQHAYVSQTMPLKALLYLPKGYDADPTKRWPLLIYLHGSNQRGNDLNSLLPGAGPPSRIAAGFHPPFIVASPQCPKRTVWSGPSMVNHVYRFIHELLTRYRIDPKRINLTGFSMGGDGTWALATAHPELFSAIAPVGAYSYFPNVTVLKDKPIWVFHGQNDTTCPINNDLAMVQELKDAGNTRVKLMIWPEADHGQSCALSYLEDPDEDIYQWLAGQTLP